MLNIQHFLYEKCLTEKNQQSGVKLTEQIDFKMTVWAFSLCFFQKQHIFQFEIDPLHSINVYLTTDSANI